MKPNKQHLEMAIAQMSILRFFPAEPIARGMIMDLLGRMVGTVEQLEWLVRAMIDRVGEWPGPKEFRGIFCTRFKPADGIEAWCGISGFTAADSENAAIQQTHHLPSATELKLLPMPPEEIEANGQFYQQLARVKLKAIAPAEPTDPPEWLKEFA